MAETPPNDIKTLLTRAVVELRDTKSRLRELESAAHAPVAIIGMDCRFPGGADSPEAFWELLAGGTDAISRVPPERWDADACFDADPDAVGKIATRNGGFIADPARFDAAFFGVSPREAESMDPQHRLLLETAWRALENANCRPAALRGSNSGVFVGICTYDYAIRQFSGGGHDFLTPYFGTGNALSAAAGRIAYLFGLNGPALSIDTACSSSLVAVHLACQSLRRGESEVALAGGVNLLLAPQTSMNFSRAHMLAPDGRCKAFDAGADGYARGEGCGMVVLKLLSAAQRDGDAILAVIRGSAVNQDGASSGLTVPNGPAQQAVIRQALADGGVQPGEVAYVEAHGTGTSLGDPIEARSLSAVYCAGRTSDNPLRLGSVKTNIGHLEGAAGVAGLIKTVLALQHGQLPASLHLHTPSPNIDWADANLAVVTALDEWPATLPRRAGLSSFGFTGTNAHLIVEAAPAAPATQNHNGPVVLPLAARDPEALQRLADSYHTVLAKRDASLPELASVAALAREHFRQRRAVVAATPEDAAARLAAPFTTGNERVAQRVAFLFSGQGGQHSGMGQALYDSERIFRATLDRCDQTVQQLRGEALLPILFDAARSATLNHTAWTQVALVALECALVDLWRSWGIRPALVAGHSIGAYAAAYAAGVFSLEDGLALVCARAKLMGALPAGQGAMAAVRASEAQVRACLNDAGLEIACINAPDAVVVSGDATAMQRFEATAASQGLAMQRLNVSHAFHCRLVEPMLDEFRQVLAGVTLHRPQIPFVSDLTGAPADAELTTPDYWLRHTREAVRFADAVAHIGAQGVRCLVELGPGEELCRLGRRSLTAPETVWLSSLTRAGECADTLNSLARLYEGGADIEWTALYDRAALARARLPGYPFHGPRHWLEERRDALPLAAPSASGPQLHPLLGARFSVPEDQRLRFHAALSAQAPAFLADHRVFGRLLVPGAALVEILLAAGQEALGTARLTLENFRIHQPLALADEGGRAVQTVLAAADDGAFHATIFAATPDGWQIIAESDLAANRETAADTPGPQSSGTAIAPEQIYAECARRGLDYGPAFRTLRSVSRDGAQVTAQAALTQPGEGYLLHPCLLDGCFQAAASGYPEPPAGTLFVPVAIRRLTLHATAGAALRCRTDSSSNDTRRVATDFTLTAEDGAPLARLEGLELLAADAAALAAPAQQTALHELRAEWKTVALPAPAIPVGSDEQVLLVHAPAQAPQTLRAALEGQGASVTCRELNAAPSLKSAFPDADRSAGILPAGRRDAGAPVHEEAVPLDLMVLPPGITRLVILCPPPADADALPALLAGLLPVLRAAEALAPALRRVLLVTSGAQPVGGPPVTPLAAAVWGMARSLRAECPDLLLQCLDCCPHPLSQRAAVGTPPFYASNQRQADQQRDVAWMEPRGIRGRREAEAVVGLPPLHAPWRVPPDSAALHPGYNSSPHPQPLSQGARGASALQIVEEAGSSPLSPWERGGGEGSPSNQSESADDPQNAAQIAATLFSPSAEDLAWRDGQPYRREFVPAALTAAPRPIRAGHTYLISGGLGDVGRHIAGWLIARGATHLALVGRSATAPEADPAWGNLTQRATIRAYSADLGDAGQVAACFSRLAAEMPPLAAIFHCAGVNRDASLANLDSEAYAAVLCPKVAGTLNLFSHARTLGLDGLVCVSSIAAAFGAPGQANYAAANAFLDAFAPWARAHGVPVQAIAFGPWDDTGMVRRLTPAQREELRRRGVEFQSVPASLAALEHGWNDGGDRLAYAGRLPGEQIEAQKTPPATRADSSVDAAVAAILRLPVANIERDTPLVALGLDSLMALEVRNWVRKHCQTDVPVVDLIRGMTLEQLAARLGAQPASAATVVVTRKEASSALTLGQRALWYLHRMDPQAAAYNIALTLRVRSAIDSERLAACLARLAARHDALCSVYPESEQGPQRRLAPDAAPHLAIRDSAGLDDAELLETVRAAYRQPFDLARGPVMRVEVFSRTPDDHVLLVAIHHIAADAWSLWRIMEELRLLYRDGPDAALPPLAYGYDDKVADEAAFLAGPQASADWAYWQGELGGELPLLALPTDRPRPRVQTLNGASAQFSLTPSATTALLELARREQTTLYTVLLAAWHALLHRYSGQDDILVGCPTSGRLHPEAANTVGYFVNPVVVRARPAPELPFVELLHTVREGLLGAMAHQELPFPLISERLGGSRDPAHPPVFQAAFVMQQMQESAEFTHLLAPSEPPRQVDWGGLRLEFFGMPQQEGQFDVTLEMVQAGGAAHGLIKYNADLWDAATMARMTGHFATLLAGIAADSAAPLGRLPLLPADERATLLAWNDTARAYDLAKPLHRWIEEQVQRSPAAIAAEIGEQRLSYAGLNSAANRLARRLREAGVASDDLVGICAERSLELLVGLLAILKAGGAYVPLDPSYPAERLRMMIDDAAPKVILAGPGGESALHAANPAAPPWPLDGCLADGPDESDLPWNGTPESLAYTIYTSGSTGLPKGAMNTHKGIVNRLLWMQEAFRLDASDVVLQKTPFSFDVSVWEFFWPLMTGARLVFARPDGHRDNAYLAGLIRERFVTTLHFVPPMLQAFLEAPEAAACTMLRRVVCSGQELPATLQARFFGVLPGCGLHNLYGPTEAAVDVTWHPCDPADSRAFVPIGKPIANTAIHILDGFGEPAPIGLPGELHIGGVQVARGYLKRPELNAERFIADPFTPGGRLYRSGDLARFLADGSIEFLGRNDFQVKIRGLRVELGEIEHALASQPGIREAVVLLREDRPGVKRLTAYCVPRTNARREAGDEDNLAAQLRATLAKTLPPHMIPDAFVFLDALPLSSSGKVARKALPPPPAAVATTLRQAPRTADEQALAEIWQELLNLPEAGIDDNFFSLGGDSIKSTQLVFRAAKAGFALTVRDVLEKTTIAALAAARPRVAVAQSAPETADEGGPLPLLPMQAWYFADTASHPGRFNQAVLLHTAEVLDAAALQAALADLAARHEALRLRFSLDADGQRSARIADTAIIRYARWTPGDALPLSGAMAACQEGLNPESGPLAAVLLIADPLAPQLLVVVHHLAVDGVSWRTLIADLESAYRARLAGETPRFTVLPGYATWARSQARFGASPAARDEALYWLCEEWSAEAPLPVNPVQGENGVGEIAFELADSGGGSGQHSEAHLLATLAEALGAPPALRIDLEGHGREPFPGGPDGSAVVGWCTALYPLLLRPHGATATERAAAVARELAQVPAGGRAFALCRHFAAEPRLRAALARIAPAQILFNYLGRLDHTLRPDSLFRLEPVDADLLRDPAQTPRYPLEINAFHYAGKLHVSLRYDRRTLAGATLHGLAANWRALLDGAPRYPLTPMQQGILFHSLLQSGAGLYLNQAVVEVSGELAAAPLQAAWEAVLRRHDVLRTRFQWLGLAQPLQEVAAQVDLPWETRDWRGLDEAAYAAALEAFLAEDRARGFDLEVAPLLRVTLLQGNGYATLVWSHHHLLLDGRSLFVVLDEVLQGCRAALAGRIAQLPPAAPFRDFVASLGQADRAAALTYWRRQLGDFDAPTAIPFLTRASEGAAPDIGECRQVLSIEQSRRLNELARRCGVTLNLLMQALLGLLLQRLSGSPRVVFGATVAAHLSEENPPAAHAGLFINTLPIGFEIAPDTSLEEFLRLGLLAQAERSPFEQTALVDIQACTRIPAGQPLFELLFLFENYRVAAGLAAPLGDAQLRGVRVVERSNFPLTLSILPGEAIEIALAHDTRRYPADAAALFLRHYLTLLDNAAAAPSGTPLAGLSVLDAALRHTLLEEWNATDLALPEQGWAHRLFLDQAARHPDAVAVRWNGADYRYGQLASEARAIAAALQARGIGRGQLVGLCCERSPRLLAGLYGILLSGAAYVPLDPGFPPERLAYMLEDSAAPLTLSENAVAADLRERLAATAPLLLLDEIASGATPVDVAVDGADPMYAIYTSGSTGLPKGVVISHANAANFLASMARTPGLTADDVLLAVTTLSFDIAVLELFLPLATGARVVLADRTAAVDPRQLMRLMDSENVTVMQATPATWRMLLAADWQGRTRLKVLCGGEALPTDLSQALQRGCEEVWNMYGPTETTVWSAVHRVAANREEHGVEPVGRPIANTRLLILDERLQPVPPGAVGELHIGGAGLALGYHRRPELTAERFIADPFHAGQRLYRTGDRARYRTDGVVEFLGRLDHQVKIRGYRIELGEIEAVLGSHPGVSHCAVVIRQDAHFEARLLAYHAPGTANDAELRAHLRGHLPEYMVPAVFVALPALPLTPNNKVDRKALPEPQATAPATPAALPASDAERQIAAIWSELLGRDACPVDESFFNLGGNSLHLVGVQTQIAARLGVNLDIVELFRHPTIRDLAAYLEGRRGAVSLQDEAVRAERSGGRPVAEGARSQAELRRAARAGLRKRT